MRGDPDEWRFDEREPPTVAKPQELVALRPLLRKVFDNLKLSADIRSQHTFGVHQIDCSYEQLLEPREVAAFTLRRLQELHFIISPGVRTSNLNIVLLAASLNVSLTDMAEFAVESGDASIAETLIQGRDAINEVSHIVSTLRNAEIVSLE
jgi:hypothetical protein